jgi:hypothetical protein
MLASRNVRAAAGVRVAAAPGQRAILAGEARCFIPITFWQRNWTQCDVLTCNGGRFAIPRSALWAALPGRG